MTLVATSARQYSVKPLHKSVYGIDLDGVAFDFVQPFSNWLKCRLNISYDDSEIKSYWWHESIEGLSKEDFDREFHNFSTHGMYETLLPMNGAVEAVEHLLGNAKDVWFITGRPHCTFEQTTKALKYWFGVESDRLIFSSGKDYKSNVVNRLDIDVFIDDGPHYVESLLQNTNARVYLMCNCPYYQKVKSPDVIRVKSMSEFIEREKLI